MGCGCGGNTTATIVLDTSTANRVTTPENCMITKDILENWQRKLVCLQDQNLYEQVGIGMAKVNSLLGWVQSALNYPDNYCRFEQPLQEVLFIVSKIVVTGRCNS